MRGSDRMHALYLHFTDAPLSDYARAGNHSAALQITFIFYSAEICMNLFSEKATHAYRYSCITWYLHPPSRRAEDSPSAG